MELVYAKKRVMVVDDTPANLELLEAILEKNGYDVFCFPRGELAVSALERINPDLILLDIIMPDMNGFDVCQRIKHVEAWENIPVIFMSGLDNPKDKVKAFKEGGADYVTKPFYQEEILARVGAHINQKIFEDYLRDKAVFLEQEVARRTREIQEIQEVSMMALTSLAETRDNETGNHIRRTQYHVEVLSKKLQMHPLYSQELTNDMIRLIVMSAPLHDIGKVGIPDHILLKPGKLTDEEFLIMKEHSVNGWRALERTEKNLGHSIQFLRIAKLIAHYHHEKWNGTGYPDGLAGNAIPLPARIMAIADVYDALTSKRVYKEKMEHHKAIEIIANSSGSHFDPELVNVFMANLDAFIQIGEKYAD